MSLPPPPQPMTANSRSEEMRREADVARSEDVMVGLGRKNLARRCCTLGEGIRCWRSRATRRSGSYRGLLDVGGHPTVRLSIGSCARLAAKLHASWLGEGYAVGNDRS